MLSYNYILSFAIIIIQLLIKKHYYGTKSILLATKELPNKSEKWYNFPRI